MTVLALLAYVLVERVRLPGIDAEAFPLLMPGNGSILALGIAPFFAGFLLVELNSLVTSRGRLVRVDAAAGRRQLNRWAMWTSFGICLVQAFLLMLSLEGLQGPEGDPLVPDPGWPTRILATLTLTAASAGAFALFHFITVYGLGNGICFIVVLDAARLAAAGRRELAQALDAPVSGSLIAYLAAAVSVILLVLYLVRTSPPYQVYPTDLSPVSMRLALLPQSILPVTWSLSLLIEAGARYFSDRSSTWSAR